ncbi:MAG: amidophosphoribosyltransferase [Candidatus Puniceispirillaceae bacterium]
MKDVTMTLAQQDADASLMQDDAFHEECAVFGVFTKEDNAHLLTALGLHALQHRGQEATGMVSFNGTTFNALRGAGHVGDNFNADSSEMAAMSGHLAIGHNRYSTTGQSEFRNIQPFLTELAFGEFALAHNGNLINANRLRTSLVSAGSLFQSTTDTEVIIHLVARSHRQTAVDRLTEALMQIEGAYALVCAFDNKLIGVRDPLGIRPLVLGHIEGGYVLASETCGLDIIGAEFVRDIEPGEMVVIDNDGITTSKPFSDTGSRFCIFEYVYFARPDSVVEGRGVYDTRKQIGKELAKESQVTADVVVPVPDSGVPAALGFAEESGIPFDLGIIRNHYIGRTFIQPTQAGRTQSVRMKHNANVATVKGKSVILIDDSIVRGTTSRKIVSMMREAGATEVHMRIASPPTISPCYYGVDTPEKDKLIASYMSADEIAVEIGADSLAFISDDGLYKAMGLKDGRNQDCPQFCDACFSGDYPVKTASERFSKKSK